MYFSKLWFVAAAGKTREQQLLIVERDTFSSQGCQPIHYSGHDCMDSSHNKWYAEQVVFLFGRMGIIIERLAENCRNSQLEIMAYVRCDPVEDFWSVGRPCGKYVWCRPEPTWAGVLGWGERRRKSDFGCFSLLKSEGMAKSGILQSSIKQIHWGVLAQNLSKQIGAWERVKVRRESEMQGFCLPTSQCTAHKILFLGWT